MGPLQEYGGEISSEMVGSKIIRLTRQLIGPNVQLLLLITEYMINAKGVPKLALFIVNFAILLSKYIFR